MHTMGSLTVLGGIGGEKSRRADESLLFPHHHVLLRESVKSKFKPGLPYYEYVFKDRLMEALLFKVLLVIGMPGYLSWLSI